MHLNDERDELRRGLKSALKLLKPGGRIAVISWKHSECAIIMDFIREHELAGARFPLRQWWEQDASRDPLPVSMGLRRGEAVRPGPEELRANARARAAVLHMLHWESGVRVDAVEGAVYSRLGWEKLEPRTQAVAHSI
jgi:16S rRNA (cytosine1402-N4)-methyltransferase